MDAFTQKQLVAELRALRARVVRRWHDQLLVEALQHYDRKLDHANEKLSEARRRERQLQDLNREKDHFLSMLAHELRNPLASLLNGAQLLEIKKDDLDPPMDRAAAVILRQTQHLAHLVDDLLDTARINSGRIQLNREVSDLVEIAREVAENFRPALTAAGHEFLVALPEEALPVDADRHRIVQVLDNLLDNAAKFTGPARGTVSLQLERADHERCCGWWTLAGASTPTTCSACSTCSSSGG